MIIKRKIKCYQSDCKKSFPVYGLNSPKKFFHFYPYSKFSRLLPVIISLYTSLLINTIITNLSFNLSFVFFKYALHELIQMLE